MTPHDLLRLIEYKLSVTPEVPVSYELRADHGLEDEEIFLDWCKEAGLKVEIPLFTGLSHIVSRRF